MGFESDWKHDIYNKHYPDGWELEFVEGNSLAELKKHEGLKAALERLESRHEAAE
jgi:hypothetical protein